MPAVPLPPGWRPRSGPEDRESLSGLLEPNTVRCGIAGGFVAVPDEALAVQRREDVHIAIIYTLDLALA